MGRDRRTRRVAGSTTSTDRIGANRAFCALVEPSAVIRPSENLATEASKGEPSEKVTPRRRWKVQLRPSGAASHDSASAGATAPFWVSLVRPSKTLP
ncbi:hypothetical protein D3C86_982700 [compost metagenome]